MKSGYALEIFLFFMHTEMFYLRIIRIYLSSYKEALIIFFFT